MFFMFFISSPPFSKVTHIFISNETEQPNAWHAHAFVSAILLFSVMHCPVQEAI